MKKNLTWLTVVVLSVGTLILFTHSVTHQPTVFAQAACPITSLNSAYGFAFEGYAASGLPAAVKVNTFIPVAAAGTITFQSNGNLTRSFNVSFGGSIVPISDSGSYFLNQDCTFTANLPEVGEVWNLVPVEGGKQLKFFVNTTGRVGAGTLTQQ
jgi:hypothetical protein